MYVSGLLCAIVHMSVSLSASILRIAYYSTDDLIRTGWWLVLTIALGSSAIFLYLGLFITSSRATTVTPVQVKEKIRISIVYHRDRLVY